MVQVFDCVLHRSKGRVVGGETTLIEGTAPLVDHDDPKRDIFSVVVHRHKFSVPSASPRSPSPLNGIQGSHGEVEEFVEYSPTAVSRRRKANSPYHRRNKMSSLSNTTLSQLDADSLKEGLLSSLSHLDLLDKSEHLQSNRNPSPSNRQRFHASLGHLELDSDEERIRRKRQLQRRRRRRPSNPSKMYFDDPSVQATIRTRSLSPARSSSARALITADHNRSRSRHSRSERNLSASRQIERGRVGTLISAQDILSDSVNRIDQSNSSSAKSPKAQRHRMRASAYASMQNGLNNSDSRLNIPSFHSSRTSSPSQRHRSRASGSVSILDGLDNPNNHESNRSLTTSPRSLSPNSKWMKRRRYSCYESGALSTLNNSDSKLIRRNSRSSRLRRANAAYAMADDERRCSNSMINVDVSQVSPKPTTKYETVADENEQGNLDQSITWMFYSSLTSWDISNDKQDDFLDSKSTLKSIQTQSSLALALSKNGRRFPNGQDASVQSDQSSTWMNQSLHSALDAASMNHSSRTRSTHSRRNSRRRSLPACPSKSPQLSDKEHTPSSGQGSNRFNSHASRPTNVDQSSKAHGQRRSKSRSSSRHKRHRQQRRHSAPGTSSEGNLGQPSEKRSSAGQVLANLPGVEPSLEPPRQQEEHQINGFGSVRRLSSTLQRWLDGKRSPSARNVQHVVGSSQLAREPSILPSPTNSPVGNKSVRTAVTQSTMSTTTPTSLIDSIDENHEAETLVGE